MYSSTLALPALCVLPNEVKTSCNPIIIPLFLIYLGNYRTKLLSVKANLHHFYHASPWCMVEASAQVFHQVLPTLKLQNHLLPQREKLRRVLTSIPAVTGVP